MDVRWSNHPQTNHSDFNWKPERAMIMAFISKCLTPTNIYSIQLGLDGRVKHRNQVLLFNIGLNRIGRSVIGLHDLENYNVSTYVGKSTDLSNLELELKVAHGVLNLTWNSIIVVIDILSSKLKRTRFKMHANWLKPINEFDGLEHQIDLKT